MKAKNQPVAHAKRDTSTRRHCDYVKPVLIRYGDIAKLTAGSKSPFTDAQGGKHRFSF